jgi:hypothetical protein
MNSHKLRKREEAEARNASYQALPFEEKMKRNSAKVQAKLQKQKGEKR